MGIKAPYPPSPYPPKGPYDIQDPTSGQSWGPVSSEMQAWANKLVGKGSLFEYPMNSKLIPSSLNPLMLV